MNTKNFTRRIISLSLLLLLSVIAAVNTSYAQLLVNEDFTGGTVGNDVTASPISWSTNGSGTSTFILASTTPLTSPGVLSYNGGGGNYTSVTHLAGTKNVGKTFSSISGTNTYYYSFLLNVSSVGSSSDYFAALTTVVTNTSGYFARLYCRPVSGGYNIGISKSSNTGTYGSLPTVLTTGTTYLILVKYVYVAGSATNDQVYVWINPVISTEPATGSAEASDVSANSDGGALSSNGIITLRSNGTTGNYNIDGIRVATGTTSAIAWTNLAAYLPSSTLSAGALTAFGNVCTNTTTSANSFTITGTGLTTANVTVGPLSGYTFSSDGTNYFSSLSLTQPGGSYSQAISVKFNPTAVQSYSGNIPVGGGGASGINVAASGFGVNTAPSVTTNTATGIAADGATLPGNISSTGCTPVTTYGIKYNSTGGFDPVTTGTAVNASNIDGSNNFSVTLTGLSSGTYYYNAFAANSGGTTYGAQQSFTTLGPTLSASPLTAFGAVCINTTTGPNSFTITGTTLTTANVTVGPLAGYTFSTTSTGTYTTSLTIPQPGGAFSQQIFVDFTPTAVQSYIGNIQVAGGGAATINALATGSGINSAPAVTASAATSVLYNSATLPGVASTVCSAITAYGMVYSTTLGFDPSSAGTTVVGSNLSGTDFSINLTGLNPSTIYYYNAYATNAAGTTYSTQQSFTTANLATTHLVISQVFGGGGNTGAPYTNDFIEIFNPTGSTVSLASWSVQYASAAGTSWTPTNLTGSIAPGKYYLISEASGAVGAALPTADASGSISMSATAGKVALVSSTVALSVANPTGGALVDLVGFGGTATGFEGTGPAAAPSNTLSVLRANGGCTDNNNNASDFATGTVTPRNSASAANYCHATQFAIVTIPDQTATVGFSVTVQSQDAGNNLVDVETATSFTLSTNGAAGTIGGTITGTIAAGTNSITVSGVTLSTGGSGAAITATQTSGDALLPAISNPFNVGAATALNAITPGPFGNVCINTTAGPNSFTISGTSLSNADVTVGPLAGFTFATTAGGTYSSTLTIPQGGGTFLQQVFVNFTPTAVQSYSGNIPVSGGGAAGITVAVSGAGINSAPSVSTGAATAIVSDGATLPGNSSSFGCTAISAYGFIYSTTIGFDPSTTGTTTNAINIDGSNNFSVTLSGLSSGTYYYVAFAASAAGTTYGVQQSFTTVSLPTLSVGPLSPFGSLCINNTAGPNMFTITGANLTTANITVGALAGFTFSTTSGGTYTSSLSVAQVGGNISQDIYVQFTPTAVQSYDGSITIGGGGATPISLSASGSGINTAATVTTGSATGIIYNSATLSGTISSVGCSAVSDYGFVYNTINGFDPSASGTVLSASNLSGGTFSLAPNTLAPGTTYYYNAYATNNGGTVYGIQLSFTTTNLDAPVATAATGIGAFDFIANWNAVAGATSYLLDVSTLSNFQIFTGPTDLAGWTFPTGTTADFTANIASANNTAQTITTNASGAVAFTGGVGGGAFSYSKAGWTGGVGTDFWQVDVNTNGFDSLGVTSYQQSSGSGPRDFKIQYRVGAGGVWTDVPGGTISVNTFTSSTQIVNLPLPAACANQAAISLRWLMTSNISVGGGTVAAAGTSRIDSINILGYVRQGSFVTGYNGLNVGNVTSYDVTGLTPNTQYYYRVRAVNGAAVSPNSNVISATTLPPSLSTDVLSAFGTQCINNTYGPNSFTITGALSTANVTVGPLAGYDFSTTFGGPYTASLSLTQPGGVYSQQIYVDFTPTAVQDYSGNIPVGGGGAASVNVAASGAGVNTIPTVTAAAATGVTINSATVPGTITATGCTPTSGYGVVYSTTNGFDPSLTGTQVAGSNLSAGNFSVAVSGLAPATTYYYNTYAINAGGTAYSVQQSFTTLADATAPTITYTVLAAACGSVDRTLTATISDAGTGVQTTGGLAPRIYYKKNAGSYFSQAGTLASGNAASGTWNFTIAVADMGGIIAGDVVSYYVIAQDVAGNISSSPATGLVATNVNTVSTPPTTPNTYATSGMGGTYTVGTGGNFTTITAAVAAYNAATCLAPTVFKLINATYTSATETFPIQINNNSLASAINTLTIQPNAATAVSITSPTTAIAVFKMLNAQFIILDGLNTGGSSLSITNPNTAAATGFTGIWLASTVTTGPGCNNITIRNITLSGGNSAVTTNWGILAGVNGATPAATTGKDNDNITISNNTILTWGYGIWAGGTVAVSAGGDDNWIISGNTLGPVTPGPTGIGINGIFIQDMLNPAITNNTIQGMSNTANICGIDFSSAITNATFKGNTIRNCAATSTAVARGILVASTVSNSNFSGNTITNITTTAANFVHGIEISATGTNDTFTNNMISNLVSGAATTTATWPVGIYLTGATGIMKIWHNSVNLSGTHASGAGTGSAAILIAATTANQIDLRNNIFANTYDNSGSATDLNYAIYSTAVNTVFSNIDNNDYCAGGLTASPGTLGFIGSARTTLAAIQTGFGANANSFAIDPVFTSTTNLHIPAGTTSQLESAGVDVGIHTDFDGDTRPGPVPSVNGGGVLPDIGADEFDGHPVDLVPPVISYTALAGTCSTGDQTITATITDLFGIQTTGGLGPRIYYKKNALSYVSQAGTFVSGNTWSFTISAAGLSGLTPGDVVSYYVVAQDLSGNVGSSPSPITAGNVNTVTVPPTPNTFSIFQTLGGSYNVGAGSTFATTLTAAANFYNNACLTGPVTYVLTDASYTTAENFPILINNNANASSVNTLTIQPNAGQAVSITTPLSTVAAFKLLNAHFVTIDGLNTGGSSLTISNQSTGSATAGIWLASTATTGPGCNTIAIKNSTLTGAHNPATAASWGIIAAVDGVTPAITTGKDNDNVTVSNNTFFSWDYAIWAWGTVATSVGGDDNWIVNNNTLGPVVPGPTGIGVNGMSFGNTLNTRVTNNIVQGMTSTTFGDAGLYFAGGISKATVTGNLIQHFSTTSTAWGILLGGTVANSNISGNTITDIVTSSGSTWSHGIEVDAGNAASNDTIANNFISSIVTGATTTTANWPAGIYLTGAVGGLNIWHNSVNLFGSHASGAGTGSAAIVIANTGTGIDLRNNIFANTYDNSGSGTDLNYAIYSTAANTVFSNINNNDYYVGGLIASPGTLGSIGGSDRTSVTAIQSGFGGNALSLAVNPSFTSTTDLHIPVGTFTGLESGGVDVGIHTDIDGDTRPGPVPSVNGGGTLPDIGADEFDGISADAIPPVISYTVLTNSCSTGDRTITATITDANGVQTTGGFGPRIYYKKNALSYISQPGTFVSGSTWSFTIAAADMSGLTGGDIVSYFVVAQDLTGNVGSSPAPVTASDVNTVTVAPVPNTFNVIQTLNGSYDVGTGSAFATTIGSAVTIYNNACLSGPVTFVLTSTSYTAGEVFPIIINNNTNASAVNTLTIQPAGNVAAAITTPTATSAAFKLLNARFVTIDGLNTGGSSLSITNPSNTAAATAGIWLASSGAGCNNIAIKNLTLTGVGLATSASSWAIIACPDGATTGNISAADNDNITISNNTMLRWGYGIVSNGNAAVSTGGNDNWVINGNTIGPATSGVNNIFVNGMFLQNMVNPVITNNTMQNMSGTTFAMAGVDLSGGISGATFTGNTIKALSTSHAAYGLIVGSNVINSNISRNTITGIVSTGANFSHGIDMNTAAAASNDTIANNMISDLSCAPTTVNTTWPAGIYVAGATGGIKIWYNSINLFGSHTGSAGVVGSAAMFMASTGTNIDMRDNIFTNTYNSTPSTTDINYAIFESSANTAFSSNDYNDYYVGGLTASPGVLANIGGVQKTTIAALQTATAANTFSIPASPVFVSTTDLHLQSVAANEPLETGTAVGVTNDFDGTARTLHVMGAHEIHLVPVITYTPITSNTCLALGNATLSGVTITDGNGIPTTGALTPRIYYQKNGGTWFSQPGTLNTTWSFTIIGTDMGGLNTGDVVSYYVIAQNNAGVVASNPSAGLVAANVNTVTTPPTTPNTFTANALATATISPATDVICANTADVITFTGTPGATVTFSVTGGGNSTIPLGGTGTTTLSTGLLITSTTYSIVTVTSAEGCPQTITGQNAVITVTQPTWLGTTSSDWNDPTNWSCGVPTTTTSATIPAGTPNDPVIANGVTVNSDDLYVASGVTLTLGNATSALDVHGNVTDLGVINGGNLVLDGAATQTIIGTGKIANMEINNTNGANAVTIQAGSNIKIIGTLTLTNGTLTTNGGLTLFSDENGTGRIAAITGGDIVGNVTGQQYLPGHRAFRHISHPFSTPLALTSLTDNFDITGGNSIPAATAGGFTVTNTNHPSAFWYNVDSGNSNPSNGSYPNNNTYDSGWTEFTSTNGVGVNAWKPYEVLHILVRGSLGVGLNGFPYIPDPIVYDASGPVNKGTLVIPLQVGAHSPYNMIGNPYPSPVDIGTIVANAATPIATTPSVIGGLFWVWDVNSQIGGGYVPIVTGSGPYNLESNGAFMVAAAFEGATLTFTEPNKAAAGTAQLFRTTNANDLVILHIFDTTGHSWDKLLMKFDDQSATIMDSKDAIKPGNSDLDFYSWSSDHHRLNLDVRPYVSGQVIPLGLSTATLQKLVIKVEDFNIPAGAQLYLHDKYLGQYQQLHQGDTYNFEVTADTATQGNNRFELSMQGNTSTGVATVQTGEGLHVSVTPNPAAEMANVSYSSTSKEQTSIRLVNVSGIEVFKQDLGTTDKGTVALPLEKMPSGIYIIELTSGNKTITQRLVKE